MWDPYAAHATYLLTGIMSQSIPKLPIPSFPQVQPGRLTRV